MKSKSTTLKFNLAFFIFLCLNINLNFAATVTWLGGSGDWNIDKNWDTNSIPTATDEVIIPMGEVFIPSQYTAFAMHIEIAAGAKLQLRSRSNLYVDNAIDKSGIINHGQLLVNGQLFINNVSGLALGALDGHGIASTDYLYVGKKGKITIYDVVVNGIFIDSNSSNFINLGEVHVSGTLEHGIKSYEIINNYNLIDISLINNSNALGISNHHIFKNREGAEIIINNGDKGIFNGLNAIFKNWGEISVADANFSGLQNSGTFNNLETGNIFVDGSGTYNFYNLSQGVFNNTGSCALVFGNTQGFGNSGSVTNYGDFQINHSVASALFASSGSTFDNHAHLSFGEGQLNDIFLYGSFHNHPEGWVIQHNVINVQSFASIINDGIFRSHGEVTHTVLPLGSFTNNGIIIDPTGRLTPVVFNQQVIAGPITTTLQDGVPYSPALTVAALDKVTVNQWLTQAAFGTPAGIYDPQTNTFTPNSDAIGLSSLYVSIKLNDTGSSVGGEIILSNPVLPITGKDPNNLPQFRGANTSVNFNGADDFQIFPNPSSGILNIKSKNLKDVDPQIIVFNNLGQLVHQEVLSANQNMTIDFPAHLPNGIYHINIYQENKFIEGKRAELMRN